MKLYRGMSDLEFYCWNENLLLPKWKNFVSEPNEAINFGKRYVLKGELIVFSTEYTPESFNTILQGSIDCSGWYQNNKDFYLGSGNFEIHSPSEAINDYQGMKDQKIMSLFDQELFFMNHYQ